jgi:cytochrome c-type biogenesis protein CcmH/NrfG
MCGFTKERGTSLKGIIEGARSLGLKAEAVNTNLAGLVKQPRIAILVLQPRGSDPRHGRAVILDSLEKGEISVLDGSTLSNMTLEQFRDVWGGGLAVLVGLDGRNKASTPRRFAARAIPFIVIIICLIGFRLILSSKISGLTKSCFGKLRSTMGERGLEHTVKLCFRLSLVILVLGLWVLVVFSALATFDFIQYDEFIQVVRNPLVRSLEFNNLKKMFSSFSIESYYPIRLLSFAVDYYFWELNPKGYHITNIMAHLGNVMLIFWLGLRLARITDGQSRTIEPSDAEPVGASASGFGAAGVGAALFAIHPVIVEPVAWVGGREEILMTLFALGSIHSWMSARRIHDERSGRRQALPYYVMSIACCIFSCWSNVLGVLIAPVVSAYEIILRNKRHVYHIIVSTRVLWLIGIITFVVKIAGRIICDADLEESPIGGVPTSWMPLLNRPAIILGTYWENLKTIAWPSELALIYTNDRPAGYFATGVLCGGVSVVSTLLLLRFIRSHKVALWGIVWFIIALLPSAQFVPHHILRADRFLYLPLAGLAVAAGYGIQVLVKTKRRQATLCCLLAIVLCTLGIRSADQVETWADSISVFTHCAKVAPGSDIAHVILGFELFRRDDFEGAIENLEAHLRAKNRADFDFRDKEFTALGLAYAAKNDYEKAAEVFLEAISLDPNNATLHCAFAKVLEGGGDVQTALEHYKIALAISPEDHVIHNELGRVLAEQGNLDQAIEHFQRSAYLDPNDAAVFHNLGFAFKLQGKISEAKKCWEEARRLDPALLTADDLAGLDAAEPK